MISQKRPFVAFSGFRFDPDRLALYFGGEMVKVERKALEVLAVLLESPGRVVPTQEIIDRVWNDNVHGVTPVHLAQCVSKLRKAFGQYQPDEAFVETVRRQGYAFSHPIETPEVVESFQSRPATDARAVSTTGRSTFHIATAALAGLFFVVGITGFTAWSWYPADDSEEVRRVLEESQKYESLVIYRDPGNVDEDKIEEYWLTQREYGPELDVRNVRAGIDRLQRDNAHYGPETRCEQFEIHEVDINSDRNFATAKTLEKWFIAEYKTDGTLVKNKTVGPYFVHYILRKVDRCLNRSQTSPSHQPEKSFTSG